MTEQQRAAEALRGVSQRFGLGLLVEVDGDEIVLTSEGQTLRVTDGPPGAVQDPRAQRPDVVRGSTALHSFYEAGWFSLNPEEVDEMTGAVLTHAGDPGRPGDDTLEEFDRIERAVRAQIEDFCERWGAPPPRWPRRSDS